MEYLDLERLAIADQFYELTHLTWPKMNGGVLTTLAKFRSGIPPIDREFFSFISMIYDRELFSFLNFTDLVVHRYANLKVRS